MRQNARTALGARHKILCLLDIPSPSPCLTLIGVPLFWYRHRNKIKFQLHRMHRFYQSFAFLANFFPTETLPSFSQEGLCPVFLPPLRRHFPPELATVLGAGTAYIRIATVVRPALTLTMITRRPAYSTQFTPISTCIVRCRRRT